MNTPETWTIERDPTGKPTFIITHVDGFAHELANLSCDINGNHEAHAKLMASAPKLIEMLKEIEGTLRWAAQEAKGKVNKETVGGWLYHADKAKALIEETTK